MLNNIYLPGFDFTNGKRQNLSMDNLRSMIGTNNIINEQIESRNTGKRVVEEYNINIDSNITNFTNSGKFVTTINIANDIPNMNISGKPGNNQIRLVNQTGKDIQYSLDIIYYSTKSIYKHINGYILNGGIFYDAGKHIVFNMSAKLSISDNLLHGTIYITLDKISYPTFFSNKKLVKISSAYDGEKVSIINDMSITDPLSIELSRGLVSAHLTINCIIENTGIKVVHCGSIPYVYNIHIIRDGKTYAYSSKLSSGIIPGLSNTTDQVKSSSMSIDLDPVIDESNILKFIQFNAMVVQSSNLTIDNTKSISEIMDNSSDVTINTSIGGSFITLNNNTNTVKFSEISGINTKIAKFVTGIHSNNLQQINFKNELDTEILIFQIGDINGNLINFGIINPGETFENVIRSINGTIAFLCFNLKIGVLIKGFYFDNNQNKPFSESIVLDSNTNGIQNICLNNSKSLSNEIIFDESCLGTKQILGVFTNYRKCIFLNNTSKILKFQVEGFENFNIETSKSFIDIENFILNIDISFDGVVTGNIILLKGNQINSDNINLKPEYRDTINIATNNIGKSIYLNIIPQETGESYIITTPILNNFVVKNRYTKTLKILYIRENLQPQLLYISSGKEYSLDAYEISFIDFISESENEYYIEIYSF